MKRNLLLALSMLFLLVFLDCAEIQHMIWRAVASAVAFLAFSYCFEAWLKESDR